MKKISAEIVADSVDPRGNRIITYLLTYPRFIHQELMTHRMFSRNSASSRAIPFNKMIKMVEEDPFVPIAWQKDHKGMQGTEYINDKKNIDKNRDSWLYASEKAIDSAKAMNKRKITKQLCNRLLEPFMWHTVLVTATEYDNFFELRCPKYIDFSGERFFSWKDYCSGYDYDIDKSFIQKEEFNSSQAEIHIQALAESMWDAKNESTPKELKAGEWHVPFVDKIEYPGITLDSLIHQAKIEELFKLKVATARCARLSYMTFDGEINYGKDIKLYDQLLKNKHMSPFEHCARVMSNEEYELFVKGKLENYHDVGPGTPDYFISSEMTGWCNNFRGFIPYRYLIENNK